MRLPILLSLTFISTTVAAPPALRALSATPTCDVNTDNCRAVINASACFNQFMSQNNKANVLNCLAGTEGSATPTVKMCSCQGCVAPVMTTFLAKNNVCT